MGLTFRAKLLKKDLSLRDEQMSFRLISKLLGTGSHKRGGAKNRSSSRLKQPNACQSILGVVLV